MWLKKSAKKEQVASASEKLTQALSTGVSLHIDELVLYQTKSALIQHSARKNLHSKMSGNYLARSKGRGMEFDEVRHYLQGDDIRAIDWRVTARTGKTHTKLFKEEVERPVLVATDLSETMLFGSQLFFKSIQASHLAALLAWHAKAKGDRVGGIVFNQHQHIELKPRSRKQGVLHYLNTLVALHKGASENINSSDIDSINEHQNFTENCARLRQLAKPGSLVYLITDAYHLNEDAIRHLTQITQHCELVVCLISDPLENELPSTHKRINVHVSNGHESQTLQLGNKTTALEYANHMYNIQNEKHSALTKLGARVISFSAAELLETQLKSGNSAWIR